MQAMNLSSSSSSSTFSFGWAYRPVPITNFYKPYVVSIPIEKHPKQLCVSRKLRLIKPFGARLDFAVFCASTSSSSGSSFQSNGNADSAGEDDFVSRVLKENPSQVEPRVRVGNNVYSLEERERLKSKKFDLGAIEVLRRLKLNDDAKNERRDERSDGKGEGGTARGSVYLKDILREHRGQLYVPEQMFRATLSEEEEFDRTFETLPIMCYSDFVNFMNRDRVKLLSFKEGVAGHGVRDFIVELKEAPGEKSLHRTKWAMRLKSDQADELLETYTGPQYEIETKATSWVGKLPEYPNPVASSISSRIMVELGMVTAVLASAAAVIGGFLASAVFAVTSFVFVTSVYVVWPMVKPFLRLSLSIVLGILENFWYNAVDFVLDINTYFYEVSISRGIAKNLMAATPFVLVLGSIALLTRFTLSRVPKNFKKWDIYQGMRFSQSKAEARVDGSTGVTFADVAGIEEAVEELRELVNYLKNPELFDKMGIKPPHGVLLEGPPGCGKTLVAKAIAGEAGVPFYQMAGSEFVEVLVGVGSARIRDLFKRAKVNKPSVVFIDEIDALATRRQDRYQAGPEGKYNAATQEKETTLNQLLIELDGFDTGKGVIFLGATNRKDLIDPALLRPGRFDRKIKIKPPNAKGRLNVLKVHSRKVALSPSVDLATYANNLPGWTGARLAQLLQEAALVAARKGHEAILESDMNDAVDRLTLGPVRYGANLSHEMKCRIAALELGTAMTSHLLRRIENANTEKCDRVSIRPRGDTASQVVFHRLDDESVVYERRPQLLHRLQVFLGGRAAEDVIFGGDISSFSNDYVADATWLARKIISIWNLENPMVIHGEPPTWRKQNQFIGPRLDFEGTLYAHYGLIEKPINFDLDDDIAKRSEVLLKDSYNKTVKMLKNHHAALLRGIRVLLDKDELSGEEIDCILDNYPANTPLNHLLEERDRGSITLFGEGEREEGRLDLGRGEEGRLDLGTGFEK